MCRTRLEVSFKKCLFSGWYWTHLGTSAFETTFPPLPLLVDTGSYWITQYINVHCTPSHMSQKNYQAIISQYRMIPLEPTLTQIKPKMINKRLSHNIGSHLEPTLVDSSNDVPQHLNCKQLRHKQSFWIVWNFYLAFMLMIKDTSSLGRTLSGRSLSSMSELKKERKSKSKCIETIKCSPNRTIY